MNKKWNNDDINRAIDMINEGKNFKEISLVLNKSQISVTTKLNRLGYKSGYKPGCNKGQTKYVNYDWKLIQLEYNNGLSYDELLNKFKLSTHAIMWAKKNNMLKLRSVSEGLKLAWERGKFIESRKEGFERYRQLCEFKFNLNDYPNYFDFSLIKKYGWYRAKNRGDVPNGVNRDHMYSIKDGFINNIDPSIISHPANCQLLLHNDNIKKKNKSSITFNELLERIKMFG